MKQKCTEYLIHTNNLELLSKIIMDKDLNIISDTKLSILLKMKMYGKAYDCIVNEINNDIYPTLKESHDVYVYSKLVYCAPFADNTIPNLILEEATNDRHYFVATGDKVNLDVEIDCKTFNDENVEIINNATNKHKFIIDLHPLLNYVYNNENDYDIIKLLNVLFKKVSIDEAILIIINLPKKLSNFKEIFIYACDLLVQNLSLMYKMLYNIKVDKQEENKKHSPTYVDPQKEFPSHVNREHIVFGDKVEEFIKPIISQDPIYPEKEQKINFPEKEYDTIEYQNIACTTLLINEHVIKFINEYNLSYHIKDLIDIKTSNPIIQNIIIQNMLNSNTLIPLLPPSHKLISMTPKIYKNNVKNMSYVINNLIKPDNNLVQVLYNYTKNVCLYPGMTLLELQTFLQNIQDPIPESILYENILFNNKDNAITEWLFEYFIKEGMAKCLSKYLENVNIRYDGRHVRMAKKGDVLNILIKYRSRYNTPNLGPLKLQNIKV
jgi:hypothetical protein